MNNLCADIGYRSLNKYGEQLCGDHIDVIQPDDFQTIIVLADGLGSGVKASILSTLTSKIISTMMANNLDIEECVQTIADTLPVCSQRQVAYSTFTIIRLIDNKEAEIFQYDNPNVILLRDGKNFEIPLELLEIGGKNIYRSKIDLYENDIFIAVSDGAVHAGVGMSLNFGWERKDIIEYAKTFFYVG
ncbi:MAG: SpoIIE family protein phosphatase, partial [Oscillospiraceae bacterium]